MRRDRAVLLVLLVAAALTQPAISQTAAAQVQTTIVPSLPALPDDGQPARDDSPIICRPGQHQSFSRLLGPPVCKTKRQWDDLHARGLELNDDGKTTYSTSPKYKSQNAQVCRSAADCAP
jgi:hypothetical protein